MLPLLYHVLATIILWYFSPVVSAGGMVTFVKTMAALDTNTKVNISYIIMSMFQQVFYEEETALDCAQRCLDLRAFDNNSCNAFSYESRQCTVGMAIRCVCTLTLNTLLVITKDSDMPCIDKTKAAANGFQLYGCGWNKVTAAEACTKRGKTLAMPQSKEENDRIRESYAGNYGWLNAEQVEVNGDWVWQDATGANLTYTNWFTSDSRLGKNCALMAPSHGQWIRGECTNKNRATLCV